MFKRRLLIGAALVGMLAAALGLPYLTPANASVDGIQVLVNDCSSLVFQVSITRETEGFEDSCGGYCIGDYCLNQDFGDGYCQDIPEVWQTTLIYEFEFPETVPDGTTIFLGADHCWGFGGIDGPFTALQVEPDCDMQEMQVTCNSSTAGCDALLRIPATAVVGQFVADAVTYWAPGAALEPTVVLPAGKTAWVLGMNATGEYYKIIWQCDYLWVPVGTMGPNPDAVWNNTPLPLDVVQ